MTHGNNAEIPINQYLLINAIVIYIYNFFIVKLMVELVINNLITNSILRRHDFITKWLIIIFIQLYYHKLIQEIYRTDHEGKNLIRKVHFSYTQQLQLCRISAITESCECITRLWEQQNNNVKEKKRSPFSTVSIFHRIIHIVYSMNYINRCQLIFTRYCLFAIVKIEMRIRQWNVDFFHFSL